MSAFRSALDRLSAAQGWKFDAAVFCLALALRLAFLGYFLSRGLAQVYGQDLYYKLALAWLGWDPAWPVDATHPPLYTGAIAAVLGALGTQDPLPVRLLQALLSSVSCLWVRRLGNRLASEPAARLAALWTAVDPGLVFFTPHLQTETLFVFMELGFFLWLYRCLESPAEGSEAGLTHGAYLGMWGAGLLGGLASLCRSVFAAYPAVLGPALWRMLGWRKALPLFALLAVGWLTPVAMWTERNWIKYHRVVPISGQMGWTLYEGFTLDREEVRRRPLEMAQEVRRLGIDDPFEQGRYFQKKALDWAREHPFKALGVVAGKAALYWRPWPYDPHTPAQRAALAAYFAVLFALAALGAWGLRERLLRWLPVYGLFAYLTAMHAVFFTSLRYRMPLEPFLCLLAAAGLERLLAGSGTDGRR